MSKSFVHLHAHTEYSMLDGAAKIQTYIDRVKELAQPAAAITDHGNLYGALEFYNIAKKNGVNLSLDMKLISQLSHGLNAQIEIKINASISHFLQKIMKGIGIL